VTDEITIWMQMARVVIPMPLRKAKKMKKMNMKAAMRMKMLIHSPTAKAFRCARSKAPWTILAGTCNPH